MKNITLTCEWKSQNQPPGIAAPTINPNKRLEFWSGFGLESSALIKKMEDSIEVNFPRVLHLKIRDKIQKIGICNAELNEKWQNLILRKTTAQKIQWWDGINLNVAKNSFDYNSLSFVIEFVTDRYLADVVEYSLDGFKLLVLSCLNDTFFESIESRPSPYHYLDWTISPNSELTDAFYSPPSQSEPSSDSPSTSHTSPQLPPPPSTPANGTNLSSSGSGAIQIINDFSSGLPGNSNAVMRSSGVTEKVMTAAAAAPENMTPVARTAARTLNGIDPLKALALVVTIISIVVSSLVVMEYNAEKHRYQDMEKALLDKYESLLSQYGKLLEAQGKPE